MICLVSRHLKDDKIIHHTHFKDEELEELFKEAERQSKLNAYYIKIRKECTEPDTDFIPW